MALVDDLQITLKEFLPDAPDRRLISDPSGPVAFVGSRLHDNLQNYAAARHVAVKSVVDQLRTEIRQHTMADAGEVDFLTEALKRIAAMVHARPKTLTLARLAKHAAMPIEILQSYLLDDAQESAVRHASR